MRIRLLIIAIICSISAGANTYYFSSSLGNDAYTDVQAKQAGTPWKTLQKLNAIFYLLQPGDSVLFKRDDVFAGAVTITKSGSAVYPIVFSAFGAGAKPIITGLTTLTNWSNTGNNIWEANFSANSMVNILLEDDAFRAIGRYPNSTAANKGYLTFESASGNSQITDNQLTGSPNWTGGNVVIRKNRWVMDNNYINNHSGSTIQFTSESGNPPSPNFGYFIQNHPQTLDVPGEWYYKNNVQKLGIYAPSGNPSAHKLQASSINVLIAINAQANLTFDNLVFKRANNHAFNINNSQHISIRNCEIIYSGVNAVNGSSVSNLVVENCLIQYTNNTALDLTGTHNTSIRNNRIRCTGIVAGMGKGNSGAYEAILIDGDNELIENNEIDSTGYNPITFRGNTNIIRNNYISNFTLVKDDGGGIYTWNNIPNAPLTYGSKIIANVILNGIGAGEGTDHVDYLAANGIYMDDNTAGVEISGNTVANCGLFGIYVHNGHELTIEKNTLFNNTSQLIMAHDDYAAYSPIRNVQLSGNILFSKQSNQMVAEFKTSANDIASFGTFDSNYYCRPTYDNFVINTSYTNNGSYINKSYDVETWKTAFGKDPNSKRSPVGLSSSDQIRFEYNPTASVKTVSLSDSYVDAKNQVYNGSLTLQPFSSVVLMKQITGSSLCPATGVITLELWENVVGGNISDIPVQTVPSVKSQLNGSFELFNAGDAYGTRISGLLCPPQTGNYTFWIAGDDAAELWLSTQNNPSGKVKIAGLTNWVTFRDWNRFASQKSAQVYLTAGQRYYIEALQKEGNGGDHLSVAWQLPDGTLEAPIPATRLSAASLLANQSINFAPIPNVAAGVAPVKLSAAATSGLTVVFRIVSGPATISRDTLTVTGAGAITVEASQAGNSAYNAAMAVVQTFYATSVTGSACSGTGSILREQWNNAGGNNINNATFQLAPAIAQQLSSFEGPVNTGSNYASRIRGYVCPPQTGNYTFWIAGDDAAELWLSTNDQPATKVKIAELLSWTNPREWNKYASQKSIPIFLQSGQRYYIEAVHQQGGGGDNLAVSWQLPDNTVEAPIPGNRLSPYAISASQMAQTINFTPIAARVFGAAPFSLSATATSSLPVSFRVVSGAATVTGNMVTLTDTGVVVIEASQPGNAAYSAATLVNQSFLVTETGSVSCSGTGSIIREVWNNVPGNTLSDLSFLNSSPVTETITSFETVSNSGDYFGSRIRGYLCAPQTGSYTFWVTGDDAAELWLSTDEDPVNKRKIAWLNTWTNQQAWNTFPSQKSALITLVAGRKYYIEALHKEGNGGDHLSVAWLLPNGVYEAPITGDRLSPFVAAISSNCPVTGTLLREQWNNLSGNNLSHTQFLGAPSVSGQLNLFEARENSGDNYAARISGYLCAPQTGNYTFWIAGDDEAEFWLSSDEAPANKLKMAYVQSWTMPREWNRYATQQSLPVFMQKGRLYYAEVLHKEGNGGDHVAVSWRLPGGLVEAPIPADRLSLLPSGVAPQHTETTAISENARAEEKTGADETLSFTQALNIYPDPVNTNATIRFATPVSGIADLRLFDLNGKQVKSIFNGFAERGKTRYVDFYATGLPAGIYLLRLCSGTKVTNKKIMIARQ